VISFTSTLFVHCGDPRFRRQGSCHYPLVFPVNIRVELPILVLRIDYPLLNMVLPSGLLLYKERVRQLKVLSDPLLDGTLNECPQVFYERIVLHFFLIRIQ
jgi:hypothetical protein